MQEALLFQNNFEAVEDSYQERDRDLRRHLDVTGQGHEKFEVPYAEDLNDGCEMVVARMDRAAVTDLDMDQKMGAVDTAETPVVVLPEEDVIELEGLDIDCWSDEWIGEKRIDLEEAAYHVVDLN